MYAVSCDFAEHLLQIRAVLKATGPLMTTRNVLWVLHALGELAVKAKHHLRLRICKMTIAKVGNIGGEDGCRKI